MFKTYQLTIDVVQKEVIPTIVFHQDDYNTAKLLIIVRENGTILPLTQAKVRVVIKKKDNTFGWLDCDVTNAENGEVGFILSSNSLAEPGVVECALYIYKQDQTLVTPRFQYQVEAALIPNGTVESSNEFQALNKIIAESKALIDSAGKIGEIVEKANDVKDLLDQGSSLQNVISGMQTDIAYLKLNGGGGGGTVPSNVILFEDFNGGESVIVDTGTTPPDTTPPENVTNLRAINVTATTVTLTWAGSTSSDVAGYDIYKGTQYVTTVTGTTYDVGGLTALTSYTFWVKAKDRSGNVAIGTSVSATTSNTAPTDTTPPVVSATPVGGTFSSVQTVTLSANEAATIYYTLDGSTPTTSSPVYSNPITISTNKTLKYIGKDTAGNISAVQTQVYTINIPVDTTPPVITANPVGGSYSSPQTVTLSANETATIYYTIDGSNPTTSSPVYSSPITISSTITLKFFGKDSAGNASTVQTVTYTITASTLVASASVPSGTYDKTQTVTLSAAGANGKATIYFTVDGKAPTINSAVYSAPINVSSTSVIRFFARDSEGNKSPVSTAQYIIGTGSGGCYLFEGSVSSYLMLSNIITFDEIIMDFLPKQETGIWQYYVDARTGVSNGYFARTNSDVDEFGPGLQAVYVNGSVATSGVASVPNNVRSTLRLVYKGTSTDDVTFFNPASGNGSLMAKVYDIQFKLAGKVVARFDFTKNMGPGSTTGQIVPDISGNDNYAFMFGVNTEWKQS
ncbi:chitobiase/beta-hexosaminidase C-terminal domain-containing protein [Bacillus mobilis]|uniref:Fibronectin type-III domain-containing protein n=2 Tax=Bacillus cereus group TaxID=86661 RepID=A0A1C4CAY4_BACCE|nr:MULTISPECIES: chitobiase/beta-hexosaminidase C-terminal domain-containing protein [Bacillus cereus group]OKA34365.1 hypothetical protein BJR07_22865 [Bacillus cereus]OKA38134.1 hypothetical protein BJR06_11855 [Bacillus cereus]SCC16256.1 Protein of unknown function [Bacillus mobilis]HDR7872382.1 chitobiase/beta-hexosaminidase C-terminal domain-containing protein [Bacillus mobilis]